MKAQTIARIAWPVLTLAAATLACNPPPTRTMTAPTAAPINSIEIVGETAIAPGQSVQLAARVRLADGTVKSSAEALAVTWRSSDPTVVTVNQNGLVTPVASQGDALIIADARIGNANRSGSREVVVQPAGTFRLVGTVGEEGLQGMVVPDARVEVVGGSSISITNGLGQYRLYGVPPVADIRITANAYETKTFSVSLSGNATRSFILPLIDPRPPLTGNYVVFIDAVSCPATSFTPALPAELQHRVYGATIAQSGSQIDVRLTGAQFRTNSANKGNHFIGDVRTTSTFFTLDYYSYYDDYYGFTGRYYPSLAEQMPDGRYLVIQGQVSVTGSPATGFSGTFLNSGMYLWDSNFPNTNTNLVSACIIGSRALKIVPR